MEFYCLDLIYKGPKSHRSKSKAKSKKKANFSLKDHKFTIFTLFPEIMFQ